MGTIRHAAMFMLGAGLAVHAQPSLRFQGTVNHGQEFRKSIGRGLVFVLRPKDDGWDITVQPEGAAVSPGCNDFVWVATPPYRFSNPRYLDTSYGIDAREAVKWSPREFAFVLTAADCKTEQDRVARVLWPYNYSEQEVKQAEEKLGTSPLGKGLLAILDSRFGGQIDWLKFEVRISLPRAP